MEEDNAGRAAKKAAIWDCGNSTVAATSYFMPHLSTDHAPAPQRPPRKPSKISRSVHGLLRAVFRVGAGAATRSGTPPAPPPHGCVHNMGRGYPGVRPQGGADGGVAEASGKKGAVAAAEQLGPAVKKSASERFTGIVPVVSRISCQY